MSARRRGRWTALGLAGAGASALVALACLGPLAAVAVQAGGGRLGPHDGAAIWFTLWQALVSALISVALAIPVARALARRRFAGRGVLVTLLGAPFILPTVVAVFGLLAIFGRGGLINAALTGLGLPPVSIYGAHGVILAHVFFNLPLATRLILHGWLAIPAERFRLAATLGFPPAMIARVLERPMLRQVVPGAVLVIFLICTTSFSVALILGGGPRATTVELAIYQALRFDFDPGRAAMLSLAQVGICVGAGLLAWRATMAGALAGGLDRTVQRWDARAWPYRVADALWITLAAAFLIAPIVAIVGPGLAGLGDLDMATWQAAGRSVMVAALSTGVAVGLALAVALGRGGAQAIAGAVPLAVSPLVLGTGLFVIIRPFVAPSDMALAVTALVNALLALPFGLRALAPAVEAAEAAHGRQADLLRLTGWRRLRIVILPRIRRPLGFTAGLSAALSMGDLGVITLFASRAQETLPLHMYRQLGSYRTDAAAGSALVLIALVLLAFWIFDRGGRGDAAV